MLSTGMIYVVVLYCRYGLLYTALIFFLYYLYYTVDPTFPQYHTNFPHNTPQHVFTIYIMKMMSLEQVVRKKIVTI